MYTEDKKGEQGPSEKFVVKKCRWLHKAAQTMDVYLARTAVVPCDLDKKRLPSDLFKEKIT